VETKSYFLWGANDPILRIAWADKLGDYFTDYTLEPAEDAGHYVAYERPQLAIDRIRNFFTPLAEA
jgi:pimeloyl-ACP methyl ester carboxylesterase